jgi:hypothetical protein
LPRLRQIKHIFLYGLYDMGRSITAEQATIWLCVAVNRDTWVTPVEVADLTGVSGSTVRRCLRELASMGFLFEARTSLGNGYVWGTGADPRLATIQSDDTPAAWMDGEEGGAKGKARASDDDVDETDADPARWRQAGRVNRTAA